MDSGPTHPEPGLRRSVWNGLRRKCPRCGRGALFCGWFTLRVGCEVCGLIYEEKQGDTWGFWVLTDRVFLFGGIVLLYVGFTPESWFWRAALFLLVVGPLIGTMPHRQGAFVALDYLSRRRWRS